MSAISTIALINQYGIREIGDLEEALVSIGVDEVWLPLLLLLLFNFLQVVLVWKFCFVIWFLAVMFLMVMNLISVANICNWSYTKKLLPLLPPTTQIQILLMSQFLAVCELLIVISRFLFQLECLQWLKIHFSCLITYRPIVWKWGF